MKWSFFSFFFFLFLLSAIRRYGCTDLMSFFSPPARLSQDIQAAECSHNTRTHEKQTFAVFVIDHDKDKNHG